MMGNLEWQSIYILMKNQDSHTGHDVTVSGFSDKAVLMSIAGDGADLEKTFTNKALAEEWLTKFVGGRYLQCESDYDFRDHLNEPK